MNACNTLPSASSATATNVVFTWIRPGTSVVASRFPIVVTDPDPMDATPVTSTAAATAFSIAVK